MLYKKRKDLLTLLMTATFVQAALVQTAQMARSAPGPGTAFAQQQRAVEAGWQNSGPGEGGFLMSQQGARYSIW